MKPLTAGEVRSLVHDPATGLAGREPQDTLAGIAETILLEQARELTQFIPVGLSG